MAVQIPEYWRDKVGPVSYQPEPDWDWFWGLSLGFDYPVYGLLDREMEVLRVMSASGVGEYSEVRMKDIRLWWKAPSPGQPWRDDKGEVAASRLREAAYKAILDELGIDLPEWARKKLEKAGCYEE